MIRIHRDPLAVLSCRLSIAAVVLQNSGFEVLGVDFLIDCHYHPWVLEVNALPSMARKVSLQLAIFPLDAVHDVSHLTFMTPQGYFILSISVCSVLHGQLHQDLFWEHLGKHLC